ncbi:MAG: phosphatidylinositol kinase [Elusimicrobia bacterium RIFOXYB2_FULL_49_7]|nr:MAG: phosphatidylinositol kinase [Elusimicrobia bacterium RIFOXYB2_FULL_49_7]
MYKPVGAIEVRIWDRRVGAVALDPARGYYAFEYAPEFVEEGIELAPLSMPLNQADAPFIFETLPERTYQRLPALLADALPDDFGNGLINAWMAGHGIQKDSITPLDRLAYMGRRGMGALEFHPERSPSRPSTTAIELARLTETARQTLTGSFDTDKMAEAALTRLIRVGTSAGGARAKAVIAWNPKTEEIRAGQFDVPEKFEHWILKFDGMGPDTELGGSQDYGRIEYAYYLMALAAGINISPCCLLKERDRAHFMTKRFDRKGNRKHHIQTLCAMAELDYRQKATHDYSQLFMVIQKLRLPYEASEEAFRRMVFNVFSANCDDHTKNISFILPKGGRWALAPAYDVTHAYNPKGEWTNQHLMSVNGKFAGIQQSDLMALASRFGIGTAGKVIKQVASAVTRFPEFALKAELNENEIKRILKDLQSKYVIGGM